jgi:hypothetical protein
MEHYWHRCDIRASVLSLDTKKYELIFWERKTGSSSWVGISTVAA